MSRRVLVPVLLAMTVVDTASALATDADFGSQPVAIGAGARALGMGGAFSAIADDATAVTWNPAGLTQIERPEAAASAGWYRSEGENPVSGRNSSEDLQLDHVSVLLPFFAFGHQQVLGVAWQRQFDFSRSIGWILHELVPGDYEKHVRENSDGEGSFASLGLSYAIEVHPGVSFGAVVNSWDDDLTGASEYRTHTTSHTEFILDLGGFFATTLTDWDVAATTRVTSGTSVVLGGMWQATPALTLAAVAKPSYDLRLEQKVLAQERIDGGPPNTIETTGVATLTHPSSLTIGAAWRQGDVHIVSGDATVTRWREYRIKDATEITSPVHAELEPDDFPDLWTLRLGYEYVAILPRVILVPRVGFMVEDLPAATKAADLGAGVDLVGPTRDRWWGASAGLGICQRQVTWDLAVQVRYGNDVGAGRFAPPDQTVDMLVTTARLGVGFSF
jgi:long-subunit fatty acid transport protein